MEVQQSEVAQTLYKGCAVTQHRRDREAAVLVQRMCPTKSNSLREH